MKKSIALILTLVLILSVLLTGCSSSVLDPKNPITITIAVLEEQGKTELAEQLFEECEELAHPHWAQDDDDLDSTLHFIDDVDETGFDPYEGCYTFDC